MGVDSKDVIPRRMECNSGLGTVKLGPAGRDLNSLLGLLTSI